VSAEGVRETLPPPARPAALLQPGMSGGRPSLVALEGPASIPGYGGGQAKAQRAEPTLPGAGSEPKARGEASGSGDCEGHLYRIFFVLL